MYKSIIRPVLFCFKPETIHHGVFFMLKMARVLGLKPLLRAIFYKRNLQLSTTIAGLTFPNKVGIAAGLDKNAEAYDMLGALGFGHVEIGTVTPKAQPGNPQPRLFRLPQDHALINRMGFNNKGLEAAVNQLKHLKRPVVVGGNIGKNTATPNEEAIGDYVQAFKGLYPWVDYITVNVSCPNVTNLHKLQDQDQLEAILEALNAEKRQQEVSKPIFLKISPDLNPHQLDETLQVVEKCRIDAVIVSNTTTLREPLTTDKSKVSAIGNGGLSGRPVKERSTAMIRYIHEKTAGKLPIIGVGGIESAADAMEKLQAGASLVQVYTGFIYSGPALGKQINKAWIKQLQK